jgi:hypothetical protein
MPFPEPRWNMDQQVQKVLMVRPACPKISGLLLRKNMRGTNVARLRISVGFVGNSVENHLHYICIPISVAAGLMGVIATS